MHALGRRSWQFKCKCKLQRAWLQQSLFIAKISGQNLPKWPAAAAASSSRALFSSRRQHAAWRRGQTSSLNILHTQLPLTFWARQTGAEDELLQGCLHTATALLAICCNNCLPFGTVYRLWVGGGGRVYQHPLGLYEWRVVCFYCCCCMLHAALGLSSSAARVQCAPKRCTLYFFYVIALWRRRGEIIIIIIICQHVRFPGKNGLSV